MSRSSSLAPMAIARGEDFSPLAWELALRGQVWMGECGEVCCQIELLGQPHREFVRGCGPTSTEAARSLARSLDHYVKLGVWDPETSERRAIASEAR